jgi:N-acetylmuramoyl-L-alanine amidase
MPIEHVVQKGDCISSIALLYGFKPETVWDFPANSALKQKRQNGYVLLEGDVVVIPDKQLREESRPTDKRHTFRRKGVPEKLKIVLRDARDVPRKNIQYLLTVDGALSKGTTDQNGMLEVPIPPDAREGQLVVGDGDKQETYTLRLGHLNPVTEVSGVQMRLNNLGIDCGPEDGELNPQTVEAIRQFQEQFRLEATGEVNDQTRQKLLDVHGS